MQFYGVETNAATKASAAATVRDNPMPVSLPFKTNGVIVCGCRENEICLAVIDFDIRPGNELKVEELPEACQKTMLVRTGSGGIHAYFQVKDGIIRNEAHKNPRNPHLKGVDVRGEGGIVFGPNNRKFNEHPHPYTFIQEVDPLQITEKEFRQIMASQIQPELKFKQGFQMILDGTLKIEHISQSSTKMEEYRYWLGLFSEIITQNGKPEDYYAELERVQPEFSRKKTEVQLNAQCHQERLHRSTSSLEYYKLFRGIAPDAIQPTEEIAPENQPPGVHITPIEADENDFYYVHFVKWFMVEFKDPEGNLLLHYDPREPKDKCWYMYNQKRGVYEQVYTAEVRKIFFQWADTFMGETTTPAKTSHIMQRLESDCLFKGVWDNNATFDNCLDGLVDLVTHEVIPHTAFYMSKQQIPRHYDPTRQTMPSQLTKLLLSIENDQQRKYVMQFLIAMFHKIRDDEMFLMCYGPKGAGKSTFLQIFEALLGKDMVGKTPWNKLGNRFGLADCYDKRANIHPDLPIKVISTEAISLLKNVTGKDGYIEVEKKGVDKFKYPIQFFIGYGTNQLPEFEADAAQEKDSVMRRAILVHFPTMQPRDPQFKNEMVSSDVLDAIYSYCVNQEYEPILPPNDVKAEQEWVDYTKRIWELDSNPVLNTCMALFDYSPNKEDTILCTEVQNMVREDLNQEGHEVKKNFGALLSETLKIMRITRDEKRAAQGSYMNIVLKGQEPTPLPKQKATQYKFDVNQLLGKKEDSPNA